MPVTDSRHSNHGLLIQQRDVLKLMDLSGAGGTAGGKGVQSHYRPHYAVTEIER